MLWLCTGLAYYRHRH